MGTGRTFGEAYAKAQAALGRDAAALAAWCSSACASATSRGAVVLAKQLVEQGFELVATDGTARAITEAGVSVQAAPTRCARAARTSST